MHASTERDRVALRHAAERLLAWGFSPRSIAEQLNCSLSWVYAVRRERTRTHADIDERYVSVDVFLPASDSAM